MSASSISRYKQMPPSHTSVSLVYDSSRGRYSEKNSKMQRILPYRGRPWGATTPWHTFLESSRQADVKS